MKSANVKRLATWLAAGCVMVWATASSPAQESKEKVQVDDVSRTYMVRLPKGYDPKRHYPVMILLHGMNQDPDDIERLTQFDRLADKEGIIAVYPYALHGRWNVGVRPQVRQQMGPGPGRRRGGYGGYPGGGGGYPGGGGGYPRGGQQDPNGQSSDEKRPAETDDIGFFNQMLDQMATKFSVDSARVYAAGLSEGGYMSQRLGCAISDRITAVAAVGASMPKTMICVPTRAVPVLMISGTSDPVVPYGGGTEHNLDLAVLSAEDSAKAWARINRCSEKPEKSKIAPNGKGGMETKVDTYQSCQKDAQVVLYSIKGAGNTWPGGEQFEPQNAVGKINADLDANEVIWKFLSAHKLEVQNDQPK